MERYIVAETDMTTAEIDMCMSALRTYLRNVSLHGVSFMRWDIVKTTTPYGVKTTYIVPALIDAEDEDDQETVVCYRVEKDNTVFDADDITVSVLTAKHPLHIQRSEQS